MEWKKVKLGEIVILHDSKRVPLSSLERAKRKGNYPYYGAASIVDYIDSYIFDGDYILLGEDGTVINDNGTPILQRPSGQFWVSNHAHVITNREGVDFDFLYYLLCNTNITSAVTGAVQMKVSQKNLLNIELPLPPLETQRRIAAILSSLDDKIENNNRINRNLEAQAQALFKSWFVDFEPWGGTMPDDWKMGTLGEIAHVTSGKRPPLKQSLCSADINIPLIGAADIMGYTNSVLYTTPILVTGRVGTHGIVQRFNEPCWPSDNTLVVEGKWYEYIYQTMCRIDYHNMNRGSTQPLITQTDLKNQKVIIPNVSILDKFETQVTILYKQVYINQRENSRLAALRDTLLPKLMKGEITL